MYQISQPKTVIFPSEPLQILSKKVLCTKKKLSRAARSCGHTIPRSVHSGMFMSRNRIKLQCFWKNSAKRCEIIRNQLSRCKPLNQLIIKHMSSCGPSHYTGKKENSPYGFRDTIAKAQRRRTALS